MMVDQGGVGGGPETHSSKVGELRCTQRSKESQQIIMTSIKQQ